jgi:uridine kinase
MKASAAYCVGIAGGTGSGKTTLARTLYDLLGPEKATVLEADHYYSDLSHIPEPERHLVNFDHPDALDIELLAGHIHELSHGRSVRMHAYDFTTHCRTDTMIRLLPRPIILIEGIFVLTCEPVVRLLDLKIYIDERPDVCRKRRLLRDTRERGRTPNMVSRQYENHVLPMHERFVEPYKKNADIILGNSNETDRVLPLLREALSASSTGGTTSHAPRRPAHGEL